MCEDQSFKIWLSLSQPAESTRTRPSLSHLWLDLVGLDGAHRVLDGLGRVLWDPDQV